MTANVTELPRGATLDQGDGSAVLLLHGTAPGTTATANFERLVPALSGYRVLAPDLLGFGASPKPAHLDYGPVLWARQAFALLEERGIDRVVVVGNSMGARVALTMAIEQPEKVRGLVLLSTRMTRTTHPAQMLLREYTPSMEAMEELIRECFVVDDSLVTPELVRRRYEDSARPGAHTAMQKIFSALAASGACLSTEQLRQVQAPALLLHGRQDKIVPAEDGVLLAQALPQADVHLLAGTGHWLQIERADLVNTLIRGYLDRCPL
ncbi:alpha/beta hydrolase [Saccharopolyspora sp. NPDC049357]|uniref:alpha/beta fold hydrolase n=1 Tax=Saccharopolyspora sp. NPDC049357 TaxID=3154507 RepID=UPI00341A5DEC